MFFQVGTNDIYPRLPNAARILRRRWNMVFREFRCPLEIAGESQHSPDRRGPYTTMDSRRPRQRAPLKVWVLRGAGHAVPAPGSIRMFRSRFTSGFAVDIGQISRERGMQCRGEDLCCLEKSSPPYFAAG